VVAHGGNVNAQLTNPSTIERFAHFLKLLVIYLLPEGFAENRDRERR
jgi:hypothetical protein